MMRVLSGIGVSPGVVAGRAVILIQRAQVLRYQVLPTRVIARRNVPSRRTRTLAGASHQVFLPGFSRLASRTCHVYPDHENWRR